MNSNSEYPLHGETSNYRKDKDCDCLKPSKVILESNYGNFGPLDVTFVEGDTLITFNQPIASVSVDSTCLDCVNIIIDFTGILNVTTIVAATSTLTFTLFKTCSGQRIRQPVAIFTFFVSEQTGGVTASHTLAFKFPSKNNDCQDCCAYILELTSISNIDLGTITYSINGIISALIVASVD